MSTCVISYKIRGDVRNRIVECSTPVALLVQNLNVSLDVVGGFISNVDGTDGIMINALYGYAGRTLFFVDFLPGCITVLIPPHVLF